MSSGHTRRVHALADWLVVLLDVLGALFAHGQAVIADFIIDSMPVPVCKRVRARRCRTIQGRAYCGYCAAKRKKFFGWRLHLVCTMGGLPVAFTLLPGGWHDLTPIHELTVELPEGAWVYGDKGYNSASDEAVIRASGGGILVPLHKDNMAPNTRAEQCGLRTFRLVIETVNSQLTAIVHGDVELTHLRQLGLTHLFQVARSWRAPSSLADADRCLCHVA